jgi:F0F1-type ATP synthase membrane subunit b/b'
MPTAFLQLVTISSNLILFVFIGWFLWSLSKERTKVEESLKELEKKEGVVDDNYKQVIDNALSKEKKIIEDATNKAGGILAGAQQISDTSRKTVEAALQQLASQLQQQAQTAAEQNLNNYKNYLNQLSEKSLNNFQVTTRSFEQDMEKQMKSFREALLPALQKEIDAYKLQKINDADKKVNIIIRNVSQKLLNKTITPEDHQKLIIDALDKARKERVFD